VDEPLLEREPRPAAGGIRGHHLVGKRDRDRKAPGRALAQARELCEEERVTQRAHAEEEPAAVGVEVALLDGARQDRHHPGDARAAGDAGDVVRDSGIEGGLAQRAEHAQLGAGACRAEKPLGESAPGLALGDEAQPPRAALVVHHRIRAMALDAGCGEHHELARLEVARLLDLDVERHHVVDQQLGRTQPPGAGRGAARPRFEGLHELRHLEREVALGDALAHQVLGLRGLYVLSPRRLGPRVAQGAVDELRLAGAARARGAFIGQLDAGGEAGVQDRLPGRGIELEAAVARVDPDAHQKGMWYP
jgi:hypothetical protein